MATTRAHALAIICTSSLMSTAAQVPYEKRLDIPQFGSQDIKEVQRSTDGGLFLQLASDTGAQFMKLGPDGEPLWSRRLRPVTTSTFEGTARWHVSPDGGVIAWFDRGFTGSIPPDTLAAISYLIRLDANGDVLWSRFIALDDDAVDQFTHATMVVDDDGSTFVDLAGSMVHVIFKVSGSGVFQWARKIGEWDTWCTGLVGDGSGGCVFVLRGGTDHTLLRTGHFDGTGNLVWKKDHFYSSSHQFYPYKALRDPSGGYWFITMDNQVPAAMRVDDTGTIQWFKLFAPDPPAPISSPYGYRGAALDSNGDLLIQGEFSTTPMTQMISRIDPNGDLIAVDRMVNGQSATERWWPYMGMGGVHNGLLTFGGVFIHQDLIFGQDTFHALVWQVTVPPSASCFLQPWAMVQTQIPNSSFTTSTSGAVAPSIGRAIDTTYISEIRLSPPTEGACALVSNTDVVGAQEHNWSLWPTMIRAGEVIHFSGVLPAYMRLFDLNGRSLRTERMTSGHRQMNVGELAPGMYIVSGQSDSGSPVGCARFIVR